MSHKLSRSLVLAVVAVVALSACRGAEEAPPPEIRPVRAITVGKEARGDTVALTGTVQARTETNLAFRIDGRLVERTVGVGDPVRPGQLIARLDPENEESSLAAAQAQLVGARARAVETRNQYDRLKGLVAENAISRAAFDNAEANFRAAQSAVEAAQAQVTLSQNRLSYTRLVSNVSGVVALAPVEPGEVVGAGRPVVQVANEGAREAVFDVPAAVKDAAPANPEITVSLTSDPRVTAKGRVREVSPRADPVTGTFKVRVALTGAPPAMRLGSTVVGRMRAEAEKGISIPASAIVRSDRQTAVWLFDPKTQTVGQRTIDVARFDPSSVLVASGLQPGDVVVTAGVQALRPGMKVRLLEAKQ
jgi:RND family efflux transporter MFP subunit